MEKTNYFTVEVYGAQARPCAQYLGKGSRVVVDAELDWRDWSDHQQNKREAVTFRARQVLFEGSSSRVGEASGSGEPTGASPSSPPGEPVAGVARGSSGAAGADDLSF